MIRADCLQDDQKQFVPLFFPFLRESSIKTSVKAILTNNHCFPFPCCLECVTLTRLSRRPTERVFVLLYQNRYVFVLCI